MVEELQKQRPQSNWAKIREVHYGDPLFPRYLTGLPHIPIRLYHMGELRHSDACSVAIIGSRRASEEGKRRACRLSAELASADVTVVSGLARGIDGAAHRGALAAGGRTLAVMGTGLEHVYPTEHQDLFEEIIEQGAALSQFAPQFTGYRSGRNFLQRNHILVGMSQLVVVVEAEKRSGSTAAIGVALKQGRPVGLLRSLVESTEPTCGWAAQLVESGQAFVVADTEDVMRRVAL
jgi:DNA processing protein